MSTIQCDSFTYMITLNVIWNAFLNLIHTLARDSKSYHRVFSLNCLKVRDPLLRIHLPPWLSGLTPTMPWTPRWGDFDIIKDQGLNHKTTMMPQVKGLLCIIPTMSSHVTWVWELFVDRVQWTHSLLSTYRTCLDVTHTNDSRLVTLPERRHSTYWS